MTKMTPYVARLVLSGNGGRTCMTSKRSIASSILLGMVLAVPSVVSGHHAMSAEYGSKQSIMTGVVTRIEYLNPHSALFMDVKNKDGTVTNWELQLLPPANLFRAGFRKEQIPVGTTLSVMVVLSKDGGPRAHPLGSGTLANGEKVPLGGGTVTVPSPAAK